MFNRDNFNNRGDQPNKTCGQFGYKPTSGVLKNGYKPGTGNGDKVKNPPKGSDSKDA